VKQTWGYVQTIASMGYTCVRLEELRGSGMYFLIEVIWALVLVGVPIALFTLAIVWWALQRGYFKETLDTKALGREIKGLSRKNKKNKTEVSAKQHPVQKEWARFGGGFYGIVAFFTYLVVEVTEIATMVMDFGGFTDFLKNLNFSLIINILIEGLTNFITAMIWPLYWMKRIDTDQTWIWFVMAYMGYWAGLKLAQALIQHRSGAES
jgi:hypothetical protein